MTDALVGLLARAALLAAIGMTLAPAFVRIGGAL